jgi:sugar/nucleoside kinase (ribokinase family)
LPKTLRIFLSSTSGDLAPYRSALEVLVHELGELFVGMEYFGARSESSLEMCLAEVQRSDIVIAVVGARYGALTDDGRSFTQREIEQARVAGLPVLVFVQRDPPTISKAEETKRAAFLSWLGRYYTWAWFSDATSLVSKVAAAIRRLELADSGQSVSGEAWREIIERANGGADFDCLTLSAHNVDRIFPVDLVAADYETRIGSPVVVAGGSGANTVAAMGRLGLRVAAAGVVGDDEDGALLRSAMTTDDVQQLLAPNRRVRLATGTTVTYTDRGGRRSIYVNPGINERFADKASSRAYQTELHSALRAARIVHYSSFTRAAERGLQESLLSHLSERAIFSLTPGALYCKLGLDRLAPLLQRANVLFLYEQQLDVLLDSDADPAQLTIAPIREKVERLYDWKRERKYHEPLAVVIKNAAGGTTTTPQSLLAATGRVQLELSEPTQATIGPEIDVRDSTGAGDASAAGILWSILHGKPLNYAVDIAYVVARSACRDLGGRGGLPTMPQLRRRWGAWVGSPHRL